MTRPSHDEFGLRDAQIIEGPPIEKVFFEISKGPLDLALVGTVAPGRDVDREAVVRSEVDKGRVEHGLACLPAIHDARHRIEDELCGHAAILFEGLGQTTHQRDLAGVLAKSHPSVSAETLDDR